ncbi:MAG: hypothetical protein H0T71_07165 [Acidobacteria bacterium]|nr:hypothetical protein [Acidobacteriota bacterium]
MSLAGRCGNRGGSPPPPPLRLSQHVGGIGAMLTCPCHAVPIVLLLGGTAGGAWLARHFASLVMGLSAAFLISLWLLFGPRIVQWAATCRSCGVPGQPD